MERDSVPDAASKKWDVSMSPLAETKKQSINFCLSL